MVHKPTIARCVLIFLLEAQLSGVGDPTQFTCAHDMSLLSLGNVLNKKCQRDGRSKCPRAKYVLDLIDPTYVLVPVLK